MEPLKLGRMSYKAREAQGRGRGNGSTSLYRYVKRLENSKIIPDLYGFHLPAQHDGYTTHVIIIHPWFLYDTTKRLAGQSW